MICRLTVITPGRMICRLTVITPGSRIRRLIVIIQIIHRIRVIVITLFFQKFLLLQRAQAFLFLFEGLCLVQCGLNGIFFCLVEILSVPGHIYHVPQHNVFFRA